MNRIGIVALLSMMSSCAVEEEPRESADLLTSVDAQNAPELAAKSEGLATTLPDRADRPFTLTNQRFGAQLSVRLEGATDAPLRLDREGESTVGASYKDALGPGESLLLRQTEDGLEDWVHLLTPRALSYRVTLGPTIIGVRSLGTSVEFLAEGGTPVLRAARAVAISEDGQRTPLRFEVSACAVDEDPRAPWNRAIQAPGAEECLLTLNVPAELSGPLWIDPLWSTTADLAVPRQGLKLALVGTGAATRVLAVGGVAGLSALGPPSFAVELFDPNTNTWASLTGGGALSAGVKNHTLSSLPGGRALLAGGEETEQVLNTAKVFNPGTSTWTDVPNMSTARRGHTATALADGRVLVVGGTDGANSLSSAQIFNPSSNTWAPTASMAEERVDAEALLLPSGKVLVVSGYNDTVFCENSSELFDPAGAGTFGVPRITAYGTYGHALAPLGPERVLFSGGEQGGFPAGSLVNADQFYDIASDSWSAGPADEGSQRRNGGIANLPNGATIVFGGCEHNDNNLAGPCDLVVTSTLAYGPDSVEPIVLEEPLLTPRGLFAVIALPDGRVMAAGGVNSIGASGKTELFSLYPNGSVCASGLACASSFCSDGYCCDTACAGTCEACSEALTGVANGQCAPPPSGTDPEDECKNDGADCQQTGFCSANGCEMHSSPVCNPTPCGGADECESGFCVDGFCCDAACDGNCEACLLAVTGLPNGVCAPILAATDPQNDCPDGPAGSCASQLLCDGSRQCIAATTLCGNFACNAQGCETTCSDALPCAPGNACILGECVSAASLCTEETMGLQPDGTVLDCAPYRCQPNGSCFEACDSIEQCATGSVCDDASFSCVDKPSASDESTGCVCAMAESSDNGFARGLFAGLLALAIAQRRRLRAAS